MSSYILPCDASLRTCDPLSVCEASVAGDDVTLWQVISTVLTKPLTNVDSLLEALSILPYSLYHLNHPLGGLEYFLRTCTPELVFMPQLTSLALRMPVLFPSASIPVLQPGCAGSTILTREQAACLLMHMMLNTLKKPDWSKWWAGFHIWYKDKSGPTIAYLHSIFSYFEHVSRALPIVSGERIRFHRKQAGTLPDWASSSKKVARVTSVPGLVAGQSEVAPAMLGLNGACQVIFANKDVSFGPSGTQEEQMFGTSPELCVAVLFVPNLLDHETLVVQGAMQTGMLQGYGRLTAWAGPLAADFAWEDRTVVFMDALEEDTMDAADGRIIDLIPEFMHRELAKAFCGFTPLPGHAPYTCISTGHWGCGAFGGHREAKALIQLLAAAAADTCLLFHDVDVTDSLPSGFDERLVNLSRELEEHGTTVGWLYERLMQYPAVACKLQSTMSTGRHRLFDWLASELHRP